MIHLAVLAGGQSLRARGSDSAPPKQFREVGGRMLLLHGVRELLRAPGVVDLTIVVPEPWRPLVEAALDADALPVPFALAPAGEHRTASGWNAVQAITANDDDLVALHDAARPFATHHLLTRVAEAAARHRAAVPAVPVHDTVVQLAEEGAVAAYLDRGTLAAVQTPQVFRYADLRAAHAWCAENGLAFTDDGGLLAARGLRPFVVMGEESNWKVTTAEDWHRVEACCSAPRSSL
jgi:2-C-methyl-D-erythritol 4-phosphate cytidylyltransferase / 2-C-methyl-D-erythritol 2,4-cyclodiphosphate synthase